LRILFRFFVSHDASFARRKFGGVVSRMQLWGYGGNGVWTDSVQGVFGNNFRPALSTSRGAQSREVRGVFPCGMSIANVAAARRRYFISAK
jgi:hypothetical protein